MKIKVIILFIILIIFTSSILAQNDLEIRQGNLTIGQQYQNRIINLDGKWEFYWNKLMTPQDFSRKKINPQRYVEVPSRWNDYQIGGQQLGSYGHATFKTTINLADTKTRKGIKVNSINSSYKLWVNGKLLLKGGKVGTNIKEIVPNYKSQIAYFQPQSQKIDIVIQAANYVERLGGILKRIELGPAEKIKSKRKRNLAFEMFLFGSLLIIAVYHFALYYFRSDEMDLFYLAVFCLLLALRTLLVDEVLLADIVRGLSWDLQVKLEYFTFFLGISVIVAFINELYPEENNTVFVKFSWVMGLGFSLFTLLFPFQYSNLTIPFYQLFSFVSFIYLIYVIVLAIIHQKKEAILFAVGLIILILAAINDILYYMDISQLNNLTPLGLLFLVLIQAFVLARNYSISFQKTEALSKRLKKERDKLDHYFEISGVMILNINQEGKIMEVNKKSCEVLGYQKDEIIGKKWENFVSHSEKKKIINFLALVTSDQSSSVENFQSELRTKDGQLRKILWTSNLLKSDRGKIKNILVSGQDITQYELLKEELEYNKLQVEFFANLSHELKTPLNLIFSALQVLDLYQKNNFNSGTYQKLNNYTNIIQQNSYRLLRLVNNLVDITKINSNSFDLSLENCNIVKVVREITYSVEDYIENKDRKLKFDSNLSKKIIACDMFSIERIILNLLSNAIKFTEAEDKISVTISQLVEENMILIAVKDTGVGIPKEKQDIIFDQFRQVDKSFTRNSEGSGIGLSIVKLLVELHNGQITVDSEYGEFTEFKIKLPDNKLEFETAVSNQQTNANKIIDRIDVEFSDVYDL